MEQIHASKGGGTTTETTGRCANSTATSQSTEAEHTVMVEDEDDTDSSDDEEMEQKHAEPTVAVTATKQQQQQPTRSSTANTATPTPTPAVAAPITPSTPVLTSLQQKYAHLRLPEWSSGPTFQSRLHPSSGAFIISANMNGIQSSDIKVTTDPIKRTLTIHGVKLPKQRRISQQQQQQQFAFGGFFGMQPPSQLPMEPHGFFTRVISFTDLDPHSVLDLSSMSATMDENARLEITIPRSTTRNAATIPQAQQQQQQRTQQLPYDPDYSHD